MLPKVNIEDFDSVKQYVESAIQLLPLSGNVKIHEAEDLAPKFLVACQVLTSSRLSLQEQKIEAISVKDVIYRDSLLKAVGKTITEKKIDAEANKQFRDIRELTEILDARIDYVKANYKILENAHIFYRQLAKGD